jgi:hypothetical protein
MNSKTNYSDDLREIKRIMEESSRFLSLSGLSGIFAGLVALAGGLTAHFIILESKTSLVKDVLVSLSIQEDSKMKTLLIADALIVLAVALAGAFYFSFRKSQKTGAKIWTPAAKRMLINLFVPLAAGGFFVLMLYGVHEWLLIVPAMLIFYGLSLVNAGKFTFNEIYWLGLAQIITGVLAAIFRGSPLLFWTFGFGFLHIGYGYFMYRKYEE